jgi:regulator of replication initiation timing
MIKTMGGLGGGICGIIKKTKHSVYNKWRTFMKKSKFRFEQHFGRTEEVIFKSELEEENRQLRLENKYLRKNLDEDLRIDYKQITFMYRQVLHTLQDELLSKNKNIRELRKQIKILKEEKYNDR